MTDGNVFTGIIRKGALAGFGLENIGNVSDINGTVNLPQSFTPTSLTERPQDQRKIKRKFTRDEDEDEDYEDEVEERNPEPIQPKFFGDINGAENFFSDRATKGIPDINGAENFFSDRATKGIPKTTNFFGSIPKPKKDLPLIGDLGEGVNSFDNAFNKNNAKKPLKRGTGFDNFIGDINLERLSRGMPDSAVPLTGVFAKSNNASPFMSGDLSQMNRNQNTNFLPSPEGFESQTNQTHDQIDNVVGTRKAGRPFGSFGKSKRQAKKIQETNKISTKSLKKKRRSELSRARTSLLEERERVGAVVGARGVPRNALQASSYNVNDGNFRGFFV